MTLEEIMKNLKDDEIMHYGRKGMRWYQHIFGKEPGTGKSSRSSSKKDEAVLFDKNGKPAVYEYNKPTKDRSYGTWTKSTNTSTKIKYVKSKRLAKSNAKSLSDRDLDAIIRRIEQENKYVSLTFTPSMSSKFGAWVIYNGKKTVGSAASKAAENAILNYVENKWPQTKRVGKK